MQFSFHILGCTMLKSFIFLEMGAMYYETDSEKDVAADFDWIFVGTGAGL